VTNGLGKGLAAGAFGALVLTAVHQLGRAALADPPRMDVVGRRAVRRSARPLGARVSKRDAQRWALIGDLAANALYYAVATRGSPQLAPWRGTMLGALAGLGGVFLPGPLGLGRRPSRRHASTAALTVAWYAIGGLAAGIAARRMGWYRGDPDLRTRLAANVFV
jgi:hypothetical protein